MPDFAELYPDSVSRPLGAASASENRGPLFRDMR